METQQEQKTIDWINCPFIEEFNSGRSINVNGKPMLTAVWNLLCSKRDLSLYTKINMVPNRHWKVSHVKKYFGISGSGQKLMDNFTALYEQVAPLVGLK